MFRDIDADYYVLVDGDDTYPSENIHALLTMAENGIDMAVGDRLSNGAYAKENERRFHAIGNDLVKALINKLFGVSLRDIMSGYRVFSQRFVKLYPVLCEGFQLETDMTIFALSRRLSLGEVPIKYRNRPQGSTSKLNTFSDGIRVIVAIFNLYRFFHPIRFFGSLSVLFFLCGLFVGLPVIIEFTETHYIQKVPSAILASGIMILSILSFFNGLVLDANKRSEQEQFERDLKRLHTSKLSRSIT
jgi:glycosyltransferase involved in cell wall biosynthesis